MAAVRGNSTAVPSRVAPRKDLRGRAIVDYVVGGWEEPSPVSTPDLFVMSKELPGRSVASLASVIGQRVRIPTPERRQLRRQLAAMSYGYRQVQQEVCNLLPIGPCADEDVLAAWHSIAGHDGDDASPLSMRVGLAIVFFINLMDCVQMTAISGSSVTFFNKLNVVKNERSVA